MTDDSTNTSDASAVLRWTHGKYPRKYRRTIWKRLRVLWLLWCVSRKYPDQRFGQIVVNYTSSENGASLFYIEDWLIIARLKDEIHS